MPFVIGVSQLQGSVCLLSGTQFCVTSVLLLLYTVHLRLRSEAR
jgi:hypothetical protein